MTEAVWCSQGECGQHQAASVIWASPGVERPDAWQINYWHRISHAHFTRTPTLVSVYRFPTICSEAMCPHTAYQIVVETARWRRRLLSSQYWVRLLRKVLGRYQYHPILASIGQYPIPQYRYRSNPMQKCRDAGVAMGKMCDTSAGLEHM